MDTDIRVRAALVLALALPAAAAADDRVAVTAKIAAAATGISSFVVDSTVNGTTGVTSQTTFVRPKMVKSVTTLGTMTVESYIVDDTVYVHWAIMGWQKMSLGQAQSSPAALNIAENIKSSKVKYLPDRQEDGTTVGAYTIEVPQPLAASTLPAPGTASPAPAAALTLTCTYDKSTYLARTCANDMMTLKYSKYNDPGNVVDLPPEAKNATPLILPASGPGAPDSTGAPPASAASPALPPSPAPAASPRP
jgi:hypothetical protein